MIVRVITLAALAAAVPAVVSAQSAPPSLAASDPAAAPLQPARIAEVAPRWTLGAGASFGQILVLGTSPTLSLSSSSTPLATASVERRVGERTWLVLAGDALVSWRSADDEGSSSDSDEADVLTSVGVGLRRVVTGPGALVDVSLFAMLGGGYVRNHEEVGSGASFYEYDEEGAFLNVGGGIALERALTEALALRISTPLVYLGAARIERDSATSKRDTDYVGLSVSIAPRLELRLAF